MSWHQTHKLERLKSTNIIELKEHVPRYKYIAYTILLGPILTIIHRKFVYVEFHRDDKTF